MQTRAEQQQHRGLARRPETRATAARAAVVGAMVIAAAAVAYTAWEWSGSHIALSTPPLRGAAIVEMPAARESVVSLRASITYEELRAAAEAVSLEPVRGSASGEQCRKVLFWRACAGWRAEWTVRRDGPVALARQGDAVRVALPIRFDGNVGVRGDVARALGLHRKNFDGALTARLDLRFDLNERWCPVVAAAIDFDWRRNPRVEIAGGVNVDVRGQVDGPLRGEVRKLEQRLREALPCDRFQAELRRHWRGHSVPLPVVDGAPALHALATPVSMAFSGMIPRDDHVGIAVALRARTEVAARPGPTDPMPLPPLARAPYERGGVRLAVPARVPYDTLAAATAAALVGQEFTAETPAGRAAVRPLAVALYPSGTRLVAAIAFAADLPGRLLDVSGTLHIFGTPAVEDGRVVRLDDVGFARDIDHPAWEALSVVLRERILGELRRAARHDLGALAVDVGRRAAAAVQVAGMAGVLIDLAPPRVSLENVAVTDEGLVAVIGVESAAEVAVTRSVFGSQ